MPQKHWVENSSVLGGQVVECKNSQGISETKMPERGSIPYFERTHIILFYFILFFHGIMGKRENPKCSATDTLGAGHGIPEISTPWLHLHRGLSQECPTCGYLPYT